MQTLNREELLRTGACVGCNLRGNDLTGQSLFNAQLRGADLRNAILVRVNLRGADLRDVDLSGAFLWGSDLTGARLQGARMCGTVMPGGARLDVGCRAPRTVAVVQRSPQGSAERSTQFATAPVGGWSAQALAIAGQSVPHSVPQSVAARAVPAVTAPVRTPVRTTVALDANIPPAEDETLPQVLLSADGLRGRARGRLEPDGDIWNVDLVAGWLEVRLIGNFLRSHLELLDGDGEVVETGSDMLRWRVPTEGRYSIAVNGTRTGQTYELALEIDPNVDPEIDPADPRSPAPTVVSRPSRSATPAPPAASFGPPNTDAGALEGEDDTGTHIDTHTDPTIETHESEGEVEATVGPIDPRVTMPVDPTEPRALSLEISTGEGLAEGVVREGQISTWLITSRPGELALAIASEEDGARFTVRDPQGRVVARRVRKTKVFVPMDGIYRVEIEARREIAEYSLTVQLQ